MLDRTHATHIHLQLQTLERICCELFNTHSGVRVKMCKCIADLGVNI